MKRFWLVLLSLGLIVAFSTSAMAVDVKFSGSFYAAGMYQDKITFMDNTANFSTAFYYQRLRLQTDFIVSPGLSLVTRLDAMERAWGAVRYTPTANLGGGTGTAPPGSDIYSAGTTAENENIAFDYAYIKYASPIGLFTVGYQGDGTWGTPFGNYDSPVGKVQYMGQFGPVTVIANVAKFKEQSYSAKVPATTTTDRDIDMYVLAGVYSFKGGAAGLLWKNYRNAAGRALGFEQNVHFLLPYAIVQLGPVKVQAEVIYGLGDYMKYETGINNSKLDNLAGWVDATVDLGIVYFGGSVAYVSGDDPTTLDKKEGGFITGGADWNPCLILFNYDRYYWAGATPGYNGTQNPNSNDNPFLSPSSAGMTNALFFQGRVGVRPLVPLDVVASVSYAQADKKFVPPSPSVYGGSSTAVLNNSYGWELDVTATYKITNNLSYMLGAGYLFTGDYFKGTSNANAVTNDFLLINKLTLTF
jgi:hypothetical protein